MLSISKSDTIIHNGKEISLFRLNNSTEAYVEVMNYGASVVSIVVPDKNGKLENVVLRYDNIEDYLSDEFYLGSTVGRYANRILKARFMLNGQMYQVDKNDGENSNHGGFNGFNKVIFDYQIEENKIIFSTESVDGEGGFPGNLKLSVTYSFSESNELEIEYSAISDKSTPVNFTNHSYFNLGAAEDILNHELLISAEAHLEMDDKFLPTGKILSVVDSAFDFREYKVIQKMMRLKKDNLEGYNAFFVKNDGINGNNPLASVRDTTSGRMVDVYTTMPGVQLYTAEFLSGKFIPFEGLCLEAQYHPDGVNHPDFVSNILIPAKEQTDTIKLHFRNY